MGKRWNLQYSCGVLHTLQVFVSSIAIFRQSSPVADSDGRLFAICIRPLDPFRSLTLPNKYFDQSPPSHDSIQYPTIHKDTWIPPLLHQSSARNRPILPSSHHSIALLAWAASPGTPYFVPHASFWAFKCFSRRNTFSCLSTHTSHLSPYIIFDFDSHIPLSFAPIVQGLSHRS